MLHPLALRNGSRLLSNSPLQPWHLCDQTLLGAFKDIAQCVPGVPWTIDWWGTGSASLVSRSAVKHKSYVLFLLNSLSFLTYFVLTLFQVFHFLSSCDSSLCWCPSVSHLCLIVSLLIGILSLSLPCVCWRVYISNNKQSSILSWCFYVHVLWPFCSFHWTLSCCWFGLTTYTEKVFDLSLLNLSFPQPGLGNGPTSRLFRKVAVFRGLFNVACGLVLG